MEGLKKVIACMKELKKKPKVEKFEDKLVIQKTVCLLELLGFRIGYPFSMYIRGPYSPELTSDLYQNKSMVESLDTDYVMSEHEKELVAKVSDASDNLEPTMLEIMATYAFLSQKDGRNGREAVIELKKIKPFYSEAKIAVGVSRAKQLFPPSEKEIKEMKAEFAELEAVAVSDNRF